ncbi:hypothetical protein C0Q70_06570 [Pomacea canaliculata]|uniref:Reverse transcriptase domain-containing protein n=1 Tax=Pomacea canaliculata TaxID=400727 RepID=A0A2T7PPE7_POMCA|nr:hypothetical protein C0Q70_06570 [Pomacea canaliculata]
MLHSDVGHPDHFTLCAQAMPTKNTTANTTAPALFYNFTAHYGMPCRLYSDQGANFESRLIKELLLQFPLAPFPLLSSYFLLAQSYQHLSAYRPGFSTETTLLRVTNDILCSVNSGNLVLLVLLDLSSAFDTINHRLLLHVVGIQTAVDWETQRVIVGLQALQMGRQFFADDTQILNSFPPTRSG